MNEREIVNEREEEREKGREREREICKYLSIVSMQDFLWLVSVGFLLYLYVSQRTNLLSPSRNGSRYRATG